jgi:hypothetical protein
MQFVPIGAGHAVMLLLMIGARSKHGLLAAVMPRTSIRMLFSCFFEQHSLPACSMVAGWLHSRAGRDINI